MYKENNGTEPLYQTAREEEHRQEGISEAERLRAKGEARRLTRRRERAESGRAVVRDREAEKQRSEELQNRSGSRYEDKQAVDAVSYRQSRYADKQLSSAEAVQSSAPFSVSRGGTAARLADRLLSLDLHDTAVIAAMVVLGVLIAGYAVVGHFYASHFYPGTQIFGIDCSKCTVEEAKLLIDRKIGSYVLTIEGRSGTEQISADEVGLVRTEDGSVESLLDSQKSALWPFIMLFRSDARLDIDTEYNEELVRKTVDSFESFDPSTIISPQDASLKAEGTGYVIVPEEPGNEPDMQAVLEAVEGALVTGSTELSLDQAECYVMPAVRSDDPLLIEDVESRNKVLGADLTISFGDRTEKLDAGVLGDMLVRSEEGHYFIPDSAVYDYVAGLAEKYDTFGGHRTFYTTPGSKVELYGGDYGWQLDQETTAMELIEAIREKRTGDMEPVYYHTAKSRMVNDIGDTYVEICISMQEMWCYKDGMLTVDTPVVTGNPNRDNGTPAGGVWEIDAKMRDYTLVGADYRTPVSYWMPFNGNVGIHDLKARYYFGGDIYLSNGSHGCVNTPLDAVAEIYDTVSVGTPVIVYE